MRAGIAAGAYKHITPSEVANLAGWWDADDATTFTYSSGTVVSTWNDKSGNTRHVSQGTVANQPSRSGTQNGRSTVVFDGSNDSLISSNFTIAQPITMFVVAKYDNADANNRQAVGNNTTTPTIYTQSGVWTMFAAGVVASATTDDALWHVFTGEFNAASSLLRLDGTQIVTGNAGSAGYSTKPISIGSGGGANLWDGDIAEVILYNSILSVGSRQSLESYLRIKWGTP